MTQLQIQLMIFWGCTAATVLPLVIVLITSRKHKTIKPTSTPGEPPAATEPLSPEAPHAPEPTVRFGDVVRQYESQRRKNDAWSDRIDRELREVSTRKYESMLPSALLVGATREECENLQVVLSCPVGSTPSAIEVAICAAGSHAVAVVQRRLRGLDPYAPYSEVVHDVAKKCGAKDLRSNLSASALEQAAVAAAFARALKSATPEQQKKILDEIAAAQRKSGKGVATVAGALVLGQLSGFALYLAATTILGGITGALGIVLPFAVYTSLTTLLSVAIGPVGWFALVAWTVNIVGGVRYKTTVPSVFLVASIRGRLVGERDQRIAQLRSERDGDLKRANAQLEPLSEFVGSRRATIREDERVRVSDVPVWPRAESA